MHQAKTSMQLPLHRLIGFEGLFDEILRHSKADPYPPFDLKTVSEDKSEIQINVAVAGFEESDIEITKERQVLYINGKRPNDCSADEHVEYQHQGIAKRGFKLAFNLAEFIEVIDATVKNGILTVNLKHIVPESALPKKIPITSQPKAA